jgi:phage minor structural protein
MNNRFTVFGKHISYDLSGYEITSGTASSAAGACALLQSKASGYSITTDKTTTGNFKIDTPASVRSYFGGKEGSFLDVFGTAEIKYDNFHIQFLLHAGEDRGVTIRYKKNLLELSQEIDMNNLYTHVICFFKNENAMVVGEKVATGLELDVPRTLTVDVSGEYANTPPTVAQLTARATTYISQNNLTVPSNNIKLDFVQSGELANRVDLCDTVTIYYEALGITRANCKCIRTRYDSIREKYTETEFGDVQSNLTDTIVNASKSLAEKPSTSTMTNAIAHATEMITGNLGGYVILHDSNGDGKPDEILIMNTEDIETATEVWRWNKNGLGYANSYDGSYDTAITQDGQIVADFITAGVLNASVIKAGILSDVNGNSTIDMTNGEAKLKNLKAKNGFYLIDTNNVTRAEVIYNYGSGTSLNLKDNSANTVVSLFYDASTSNGGQIRLFNLNQKSTFNVWANNSLNEGCVVWINDKNGNNKVFVKGTPNGGIFQVYDSSGTASFTVEGDKGSLFAVLSRFTASQGNYGASVQVKNNSNQVHTNIFTGTSGQSEIYTGDGSSTNIYLHGGSGNITCVSLTQTSSRKVKKNIEDIDDSEKILLLQAVRFDFINEQRGKDKRGFIAEDVAEILPNLVTEASDDTPASLDYIGMIPYLQDVIKKQQKKIDELESKLNAIIEKIGG